MKKFLRAGIALGLVTVLGWLGGCSDNPGGPGGPQPPTQGPIVSEPVPLPGAPSAPLGSVARAALQEGDGVTYVSLRPGTVPGGQSAAIQNLTNGFSATADVVDGGFDPVPLLASVGDAIEVVITDGSGGTTSVTTVVRARRPPIVVRTVPPGRKTDVPLNSVIQVVFSEPMDPRTITTETVRLLRNTTPVAGRVEMSADGLRADFVPDSLLAGATSHTLVVETGAADLSGDALEQPVAVDFTTANQAVASPVASVLITPGNVDLAAFAGDSQGFTGQVIYAGERSLTAIAADSNGAWIRGRTVTWTNSNPSVARLRSGSTIDSTFVEPVAPGRASITATVDGVAGTAAITVLAATVEPEAATLRIGDTLRVVVKVKDSAGRVQGSWQGYWSHGASSSVLTYRSVSQDTGLVTALGPGNELVRVAVFTPGGLWAGAAFVRVTVTWGGGPASIAIAPDTVRTVPGAYLLLRATLQDATGAITSAPLSWSSSPNQLELNFGLDRGYPWNEAVVATHDATGTFTITATAEGRSDTSTVISDYITIAAVTSGCALTSAGQVYCAGAGQMGQLGYGLLDERDGGPVAVAGRHTFTAISSGANHRCALTTTGAAYCWGSNWQFGQLGTDASLEDCSHGTAAGIRPCSPSPVPVAGGRSFVQITAGTSHTCALTAGGAAYCWGMTWGVGDGTTSNRSTPVAVAGGLTFSQLSAGAVHTCALTSDGRAYCWGHNEYGVLGDGSTTDSYTPVAVAGGLTFTSIAAGGYHTCALATGGAAYCWGNRSFALGDTAFAISPTPVPVAPELSFTGISASALHSCGLTSAGDVYCWGTFYDAYYYDPAVRMGPTLLSGGLTFLSVSSNVSCGITTAGVAYCWSAPEYPVKLWGQR